MARHETDIEQVQLNLFSLPTSIENDGRARFFARHFVYDPRLTENTN